MGSVLTQRHHRLVSLGAVLCAGLRLPSVTRRSFSASGQMAEKEFTGDVMSDTWMSVYAKWTGGVVQAPWFGLQSVDHRSDLVFLDGNLNVVCYRDKILGPVLFVLLSLEQVGDRAVFQHDNAITP